MSEYPIRSTARIFYDSDGNETSLYRLINLEPEWAKNRILDLEESNEQLQAENEKLRQEVWREAIEIAREHGRKETPYGPGISFWTLELIELFEAKARGE